MLRFILNTFLILLALRFVSLIARAITAGRRQGPRLNEEPQAQDPHAREAQGREPQGREPQGRERQGKGRDRRSGPRIQRSDAVDVPFTEIPPDSPP